MTVLWMLDSSKSWNPTSLFVIVGLDPTIQAIFGQSPLAGSSPAPTTNIWWVSLSMQSKRNPPKIRKEKALFS
ncbi:MAG: hypothetical protein Q8O43_07270 [Dehalococcoidia bacterium]|nr:hypothetical protein [Dehalococcoidia bacterium]